METLCTRPSGRLRGLALIFGRPPAFLPPSTQPCRAPGPTSVWNVVKQGLTRWWRVLPKQWPTGAASRGCRGRRRGETTGRGPVWETERKTPMRTVCVIISKPQLLSCAFVSKLCYFTRLQGNALFCVCTWVCLCSFLHGCACLLDICDHFIVHYVQTRPSTARKGACDSHTSLLRTNLGGLLGLKLRTEIRCILETWSICQSVSEPNAHTSLQL